MSIWHVACIESGRDKRLSRLLDEREIQHYIPYSRQVRARCITTPFIETPLLPGYAFFRLPESIQDWPEMESIPHFFGLLRFGTHLATLSDYEIDQLRILADLCGRPADPMIGETVEIAAGPLVGLRGVVVDSRKKIIVRLEMLNRSVKVPFEAWMLKASFRRAA